MKKLAILMGLALVAGSASATIILTDAQWASATVYGVGGPLGTLDSIVDGSPAEGDIEFTVTVDATLDGGGYTYGFVEVEVPMGGIAGDVWELYVENTSAAASSQIFMAAVTNGVRVDGGPSTGIMGAGDAAQTLSWDMSALTSIDSLTLWMAAAPVLGGTTITTMVPEPATFGLMALLGGGMLWIRKRFTS
ncbi:MAG: hypothetical protein DRQ89_14750 [Epsilonproteobacteria bacterium]|nr:MAG: hypothetical protein DRQ89_14750 [Campylobacterota bacterium]